jgi:hypothetical protein
MICLFNNLYSHESRFGFDVSNPIPEEKTGVSVEKVKYVNPISLIFSYLEIENTLKRQKVRIQKK